MGCNVGYTDVQERKEVRFPEAWHCNGIVLITLPYLIISRIPFGGVSIPKIRVLTVTMIRKILT